MSEKILYEDSNIVITSKRISTNSETYPVKQVTSVGIYSTKEDPTIPTNDSSGLPGVLFFSALAGAIVGNFTNSFLGWLVFFVLVGGFVLYSISIKPVFHLRIGVSSKELEILNSNNKEYTQMIHDKINEAIFNS